MRRGVEQAQLRLTPEKSGEESDSKPGRTTGVPTLLRGISYLGMEGTVRPSPREVAFALATTAGPATQSRLDSDRRLGSDYWGLFERAATDADAGDRRRVLAYEGRAFAPYLGTKGLRQAKEWRPQGSSNGDDRKKRRRVGTLDPGERRAPLSRRGPKLVRQERAPLRPGNQAFHTGPRLPQERPRRESRANRSRAAGAD
jgi:hypothetical protein